MTQAEVEKKLQELAGSTGTGRLVWKWEDKEIDNPKYVPSGVPGFSPNTPPKVKVRVESWTNPDTNGTYTINRFPDGTISEVGGSPGGAAKPATATAVTTSTRYEWRQTPDGGRRLHIITTDQKGNQLADDEATPAQEREYRESEERAANNGYTKKELEERDERNRPTITRERITRNGRDHLVITSVSRDGKTVSQSVYDPDGKPVPRLPDEAGEKYSKPYTNDQGKSVVLVTDRDGKPLRVEPAPEGALPQQEPSEKYSAPFKNKSGQLVQNVTDRAGKLVRTVVVGTGATTIDSEPYKELKDTEIRKDPDTGLDVEVIRDPVTREVKERRPLPRPTGAPAPSAGPPMPQILVGSSVEALRKYAAELDAEVAAGRMTPTERARRYKEASDLAVQAVQEANVYSARMGTAISGFNSALDFAESLNKFLPVGSSLGGQAFAALLGIQLYHAQQMAGLSPATAAVPAAPPPAAPAAQPPPPASPAAAPPPASWLTRGTAGPFSTTVGPPPALPPEPGAPGAVSPSYPSPPSAPGFPPGTVPPSAQATPEEEYAVLRGMQPQPLVAAPPMEAPAPVASGDFAVLAQQPAAAPSAPAVDMEMPRAVLETQAAITPVWRMSPEEVEEYRRRGISDAVIFGLPGVAA